MPNLARLCLVATLLVAQPASGEPFSLVLLPDSQYYTTPGHSGTPEMFTAQTAWIVENLERHNIAFVLHEGDITHDNDTAGWLNAVSSLSLLDDVVPYALAVGNHDGLGNAVGDTAAFNAHFPVSQYRDLPTFGGVFETDELDNSYHLFSAGGVDWLILVLEFGPRDVVLTWADGVMDSYPERRVILLTHAHVYYDDRLHGSLDSHSARPVEDYGRENNGDDVWETLLASHANAAFTFNGHVLGDGQGRLVGTGTAGNAVYQMLSNFQNEAGGGFGFLRLVQLSPAHDRLVATSYSPYLDEHRLGTEHQFVYDDVGVFADTFAPQLQSYATFSPTRVHLTFDEPLDATSAVDPQQFTGIEVLDAVASADGQTVVLTTSPLEPCQHYRLAASTIADRAANGTSFEHTINLRRQLLEATFDGDPEVWTVVDRGPVASSDWRFSGGQLVQLGNIYGPETTTSIGREGTTLHYNRPGARLWSDYTLELTMMTTDNDGIGVLFRYVDEQNHYKLELDRQRSFRRLIRAVGGVETVLAETSDSYEEDQQIAVMVAVAGNTIRAFVGGEDLFGPVTDGALAAGTIGLWAWGAEGLYVDDLWVSTMIDACEPCPGGAADYRSCYDGPEGTQGRGRCSAGEKVCSGGVWSVCLGQVLPALEQCSDGLDNDCDGAVDALDAECGCSTGDRRPCYTGPPESAGVGVCGSGEETCQEGVWGGCVGQTLPSPEQCGDGEDDDCDGDTDEDCPVDSSPPPAPPAGCGCSTSAPSISWLLALLFFGRRRRR